MAAQALETVSPRNSIVFFLQIVSSLGGVAPVRITCQEVTGCDFGCHTSNEEAKGK